MKRPDFHRLFLVTLSLLALPAKADSKFDPTEYIKQREMESTKAIIVTLVELDGAWYRRFSSPLGSIMVPLTSSFIVRDLAKAKCSTFTNPDFVGNEVGLDEKIVADSDAIESAIAKSCGVAP